MLLSEVKAAARLAGGASLAAADGTPRAAMFSGRSRWMAMASAAWLAALLARAVLQLAGCLQASVAPVDDLQGPPSPPTLVLRVDEREDMLVLTAVGAGFEWATFGVSADPAGTQASALGPDDEAEGPRVALVPGEFRTLSGSPEQAMAGDFLRLCSPEGEAGPVTYTVADLETNAIVATATFQAVALCA